MKYLILIFINTFFFITNIYPKHVIEYESVYDIISILFNLIFYAVFYLFLTYNFGNQDSQLRLCEPSEKRYGKLRAQLFKFAVFIGIQIAYDLLGLFLFYTFGDNSTYAVGIILFSQWVIFYLITSDKKRRFFREKWRVICTLISLFALLALSVLFDITLMNGYHTIGEVYDLASTERSLIEQSMDFIFELKTCILDILIGFVLLFAHSKSCKYIDDGHRTISKTITRIMCVICIFITALFLKLAIAPEHSIIKINVSSDINVLNSSGFGAETKTIVIKRYDNNLLDNIAFCITKNKLFHEGDVSKTYYSFDVNGAYKHELIDNSLVMHSCFEDILCEWGTFCLYKNQVLCYVDNGAANIILPSDVRGYDESEALTSICKKLLELENNALSDFCARYLLECSN